jgi:hypothetical protein
MEPCDCEAHREPPRPPAQIDHERTEQPDHGADQGRQPEPAEKP